MYGDWQPGGEQRRQANAQGILLHGHLLTWMKYLPARWRAGQEMSQLG